jgi:hypothetical protein
MRYCSVRVIFWMNFVGVGVFAEGVHFDVERAAGGQGVEAGGRIGVGDDGYLYLVAKDGGDGEADAFDGDGALGNDVAGEGLRGAGCGGTSRCRMHSE